MSRLPGMKNAFDILRQAEAYRAEHPVDPDAPSPLAQEIERLKQLDEYKNLPQKKLVLIAWDIIQSHNSLSLTSSLDARVQEVYKFRPDYKIWNAYTYEEIIQMEGGGVNIPKDLLDWAHSMEDRDVTDYEVTDEDEAETSTTMDNGDETHEKLQKQATEYTKQSKEKKEGLFTDFEKFVPLTEKAKQIQADAENEEKNAIKKAEKLLKEWTELDKKVQDGVGLTAGEQKRYRELGVQLNGIDGETTKMLMDSADDLDELVKTMDRLAKNITSGIDIATKAVETGKSLADYEAGYDATRCFDIETFASLTGDVKDQMLGAQGESIARDAVDAGADLYDYSMDIDQQINTNTNAALYEFSGNYKQELDETVEETKEEMGDNFNVDSEEFKEMELQENDSAAGLRQTLDEEGVSLIEQGKIFAKLSEEKTSDVSEYTKRLVKFEEEDSKNAEESEALAVETQKKLQPKIEKYNKTVEEILAQYQDIDIQNKNDDKVNGPATANTTIIKEEDKTAEEQEDKNNTDTATDAANDITAEEAAETPVDETANTQEEKSTEEENESQLDTSNIKTASQVSSNDPKLKDLEQQEKEITNTNNEAQQEIATKKLQVKTNKNSREADAPKIEDTKEYTKETIDIGAELIGGRVRKKIARRERSGKRISEFYNGAFGSAEAISGMMISGLGAAYENMGWFFGQRYKVGGMDLRVGGQGQAVSAYGEEEYEKAEKISEAGERTIETSAREIYETSEVEKTAREVEIEVSEKQAADAEKEGVAAEGNIPTKGAAVNVASANGAEIGTTTSASGAEVVGSEGEVSSNNGNEQVDAADQKDKSEEDQKTVDNADKENEKTDAEAQDDAKEADNEDKDTNKKIKENEREHKLYQKEIEKINEQQEKLFKELEEMMAKMEEYSVEQANADASSSAMPAANAAAPAANGNNPVTNVASMSLAAEPQAPDDGKAKEIESMSQKMPVILKSFQKNEKTLNTIQRKSNRNTRQLTKLYKKRQKENQIKAKKEQDRMAKNQKIKDTITIIGQAFTLTKTIGNALIPVVVPPWVSPMGQVMFYVGKYGEISCSLTNAAIDACNGNLVGALVNVASAAMSAAAGPASAGASQATTQGASQAAQAGAQAGTQAAAEAGAQAATQAGTQAAQASAQAGLQQVTEASKQFADNTIKEATKETVANLGKEAVTPVVARQLGEQALDMSLAPMAQQALQETGKTTLKQVAVGGLKQAAPQLLQSAGAYAQQKFGQNDAEVQKQGPVAIDWDVMARLAEYQRNRYTHNTNGNNDQNNIVALDRQNQKNSKVKEAQETAKKKKKRK